MIYCISELKSSKYGCENCSRNASLERVAKMSQNEEFIEPTITKKMVDGKIKKVCKQHIKKEK